MFFLNDAAFKEQEVKSFVLFDTPAFYVALVA